MGLSQEYCACKTLGLIHEQSYIELTNYFSFCSSYEVSKKIWSFTNGFHILVLFLAMKKSYEH